MGNKKKEHVLFDRMQRIKHSVNKQDFIMKNSRKRKCGGFPESDLRDNREEEPPKAEDSADMENTNDKD